MSTVEEIREAATLMRGLAEAATPGRWEIENRVILVAPELVGGDTVNVILGHVNQPGIAENERNAEHIASWHPAVALAVADWLDHAAARAESKVEHGGIERVVWSHERDALAVARAYLGRAS